MAEHRGAGLESGALLDLALEALADATQAGVPELVGAAVVGLELAAGGRRALGDDDDREVAPALVAAAQQPRDLVHVERALGDQDHVGPAGHARMQRDPARVAAHHLDDQHPVVALGGRVQPVDRLRRDMDGRIEAERHIGAADVVVDRLRHPEHRHPRVVERRGGAERVLAADGDQPVDLEPVEVLPDPLDAPIGLERIGSRGAEDRPAAWEDPADRLDRELLVGALERPAPAVVKADDRVAEAVYPPAHDRADDGVQSGTVAAPGQDPDAHAWENIAHMARRGDSPVKVT